VVLANEFSLQKLQWSIQHRGLASTLQAAVKGLGRRLQPQPPPPPHPFDLEHGTDTGGLIPGSDLASGSSSDRFITGYAAVPPSRLQNILARWQASHPPHPLADYAFVDVGCGKGRALLLASELNFHEIIGIELNPRLATTAQANVNLWIAACKARCPIRVERSDAVYFSWPMGPCVAFLFNPLGKLLTQRLASRLAVDFRDRPVDLEIFYYKPEHANAFDMTFAMIWCEATGISPEDLAVDPVADSRDLDKERSVKR
jgi:hypothetical protein